MWALIVATTLRNNTTQHQPGKTNFLPKRGRLATKKSKKKGSTENLCAVPHVAHNTNANDRTPQAEPNSDV
jgi:hypothetical protein